MPDTYSAEIVFIQKWAECTLMKSHVSRAVSSVCRVLRPDFGWDYRMQWAIRKRVMMRRMVHLRMKDLCALAKEHDVGKELLLSLQDRDMKMLNISPVLKSSPGL